MGKDSAIAWTHHTFNPWWGCVEVGPECDHCYARELSQRLGRATWGPLEPRRFFSDAHWHEPEKWNMEARKTGERRRVFCASMADVMENRRDLDVPRERLWRLIENTEWLDWLLLTKRPLGFRHLTPPRWNAAPGSWPRNVWAMVTSGCEQSFRTMVSQLLYAAVYAPVRGLSYEPALGPLPNLADYLSDRRYMASFGINWVIFGGESGAGYRQCDLQWARDAKAACDKGGVPFFFKQDSAPRSGQRGRAENALWNAKALPR